MTFYAKAMGYRVVVMGAHADDPAAQVADEWVEGDILTARDVASFADRVDGVTIETENVSFEGLKQLERHLPVHPGPEVVAIAQDRLNEKLALQEAGVPTAPFHSVKNEQDLRQAVEKIGFPLILKTTRGGYDGKGQAWINTPEETDDAFRSLGEGTSALIAEGVVAFDKEISVVAARNGKGEVRTFPPSENEHRQGILHRSIAPARIPESVAAKARRLAERIAEKLNVVGMIAVEMFLVKEDTLLVNEIAPRPHNSGHHTMDACVTSQFEQTVRSICGLGLGETDLLCPAVMINLLGEHLPSVIDQYQDLTANPRLKIHLYGKRDARKGRKMGHLLVTGNHLDETLAQADMLCRQLGIDPEG